MCDQVKRGRGRPKGSLNKEKKESTNIPGEFISYVFTDFLLRDWQQFYTDNSSKIRFIGVGLEVCPTTNRQHYQGWMQFHKKTRHTAAKKVFKGNYIAPMFANDEANKTYCSKGKNYTTYGSPKTKGQRTDLEGIFEQIRNGTSLIDIADANPGRFCQYRGGLNQYKAMCDKRNALAFRHVQVFVYWGPTRTGKTKAAMASGPADSIFLIHASGLQWWCGYEGEPILIIDEYDSSVCIIKMLQLLDGYRCRLDIKGGHTYARWTTVYITSNINPLDWHPNAKQDHREALMARITDDTKFE